MQIVYIREDILSKLVSTDLSIDGFFVEIRLRKKTWLLCSYYNLKKNLKLHWQKLKIRS